MSEEIDIFLCKKCGQRSKTLSVIDGRLDCGHSNWSKERRAEGANTLRQLNEGVRP